MLNNLLLEFVDVVSEFRRRIFQLFVGLFEVADAAFQSGNSIQLPLSAFGGCQTVAGALAFQLDLLLRFHIDGTHASGRRGSGAAGGGSGIRLALELQQPIVGEDSLRDQRSRRSRRSRCRGRRR